VKLRVIDCSELVLPQRPVVSVSEVKVNALILNDWVLSGDRLLRTGGWHRLPGTTTYPDPGLVQVTYTHGWDEIPDDVRAVCLDLASTTLSNPSMLRQEGIDDYTRTFASETLGLGSLSDAHKELWATSGVASARWACGEQPRCAPRGRPHGGRGPDAGHRAPVHAGRGRLRPDDRHHHAGRPDRPCMRVRRG
jgi:hypothetical protein